MMKTILKLVIVQFATCSHMSNNRETQVIIDSLKSELNRLREENKNLKKKAAEDKSLIESILKSYDELKYKFDAKVNNNSNNNNDNMKNLENKIDLLENQINKLANGQKLISNKLQDGHQGIINELHEVKAHIISANEQKQQEIYENIYKFLQEILQNLRVLLSFFYKK